MRSQGKTDAEEEADAALKSDAAQGEFD